VHVAEDVNTGDRVSGFQLPQHYITRITDATQPAQHWVTRQNTLHVMA